MTTDSVAPDREAGRVQAKEPAMILAALIAVAVFILIAGEHALSTWNQR
jgi:hypothetical protein